MNEISFNGGYLLNKPSKKVWENIQKELPSSKCIIENLYNKGDRFFAVKNIYDKEMAGIILRKNLKFRFYPEINLKSRLDAYYPEQARSILNEQTNVIDNKQDLRDFIKELKTPNVFMIRKYRWKPNDHIEKTLKEIGLTEKECDIEIKSGITYIYNKAGKIIAKASPNNNKGTNFIYVFADSLNGARRLALSQNGETYEFSPLQYDDFFNNFMKNVKIDLGKKRSQKS